VSGGLALPVEVSPTARAVLADPPRRPICSW
jgi:hypothetical protein